MVRKAENYGRQIFVYRNFQTNQVVYSLTRALKNKVLKQLPFITRKTVPTAVRKDVWSPMATISFPSTKIGLSTYHKLREFRKLHETAYDDEIRLKTSMKERKWKLMDQKANSVADIAESLRMEVERNKVPEGEIMVTWADLLDAEYAQSWPKEVLHGKQPERERYCAPKLGEFKEMDVEIREKEAPVQG